MIDDALIAQLRRWVNEATPPSASVIQSLRRQFGHDRASLLVDSIQQQRKARDKFGDGLWWITPRGLQQSTSWQVARIKASWLGKAPVLDLCCGLGGDTRWLAERGPTWGVDSDATILELAQANVEQFSDGRAPTTFVCDDAINVARGWNDAMHIDPDRRPTNQRTTNVELFSPDWAAVESVIQRASAALVKLAPATELDDVGSSSTFHRCWISLRGSVREQTLLVGDAVHNAGFGPHGRSAVIVRRDGMSFSFSGQSSDEIDATDSASDWMVDPDPAIRSARLTEAFARTHALRCIGIAAGFLTSRERPECGAFAIVEQVAWQMPYDVRRLKKQLRSRNQFASVIKTRGVPIDPAELRKKLRNCGESPVTLWIGRSGQKIFAVATLPDASSPDTTSDDDF